MFFILRLILVGLLFGAAARWLYPGLVPMGWIATILLGLGGSLLGGFVGSVFSRRTNGKLEPAGCLGSILGAMVLIFLGRHLHLM